MTFAEKVYKVVKSIPAGKVASYGQVAALIGHPRAARQVGFALRNLGLEENDIPWWRVVNKEGYLSINHGDGGIEKEVQRDWLMAEAVVVEDFQVDMNRYRF